MALALVVTAQFMVILDVTIVNVALPAIQSDLDFAQETLQWVITAYTIMFGGTLLLGGRLADLLGRRRVLLVGLALFSFSSLLCGLAWSESSLIAFRAAQGLGAALLVPAALALLVTTFAEGRERNLALGIYGAAAGSGAAVGVLLGGLLTTYLSWPWIFFVNVPVGLAAIAFTPLLLRESRAVLPHRHFDLAGASSVTGGLMLLVYALTRATSDGWGATTTLALLTTSVALLLGFVAIELRSGAPLLPLRIFRLRTLAAANATIAVVGAGAFSEFFLLTLYSRTSFASLPSRRALLLPSWRSPASSPPTSLRPSSAGSGFGPCSRVGFSRSPSRSHCLAACRWRDTISGISSPPSCSAAPAWESPSSPPRLEA
jgi:EmrB/QacA subfamily drug resistance transporter